MSEYGMYEIGAALDGRCPGGPMESRWERHRQGIKLVNPSNKRKYTIIVVGTGLAGASAAASLAELGYKVKAFTLHDSPRRAHSIAAQGGINAAKNYPNDGDSVHRLFYDTVKGGDYRARESNVHRLAEVSNAIIDQCAAQGIPFAREYGGSLANRSFGGAQVSRTFYARGQTGQQLLLGAYGALMRQVEAGKVEMFTRHEMLDLVMANGKARGIVARNLITGAIDTHVGHAVCLCTGGYANVFYLSTNAANCNVTAIWRAARRGAYFANPCFTQIHPTCLPQHGERQTKLTLMSESLRNDGRVWAPRNPGDKRPPNAIAEEERDYFLERRYPSFGNLTPRDVASRAAKLIVDEGRGAEGLHAVFLDFRDAIQRDGRQAIEQRYGNLFEMYELITGVNGYETPMRIYPAPHYAMGGLWVDYNLMSNLPGLFVLGEANFSDHGANRLGASALMQGLADGYFVIPYTIGDYLAQGAFEPMNGSEPAFQDAMKETRERIQALFKVGGKRPAADFHRELGKVMWNHVGMARTEKSLKEALKTIPEIREAFWQDLAMAGGEGDFNQTLEYSTRVADYMEFAELLALDALHRDESCGGHFREERQTPDNEAQRVDDKFSYAAGWEWRGVGVKPVLHKEELSFEAVKPSQRSYK